jgi:hypothetical protein
MPSAGAVLAQHYERTPIFRREHVFVKKELIHEYEALGRGYLAGTYLRYGYSSRCG